MRIAVVNTQAPFVHGGAEEHAAQLCEALRAAGHRVEPVAIPFNFSTPDALLDHAVAASAIDLSAFFGEPVDLMIGLRFPAYLVQHPNKAVWLLHQYREAYDLWDAGRSGLRADAKGNLVRQIIHDMDNEALSGARCLRTNSDNVSQRLKKYNGIEASALYHPPPLARELCEGPTGDYFYFPSRISGLKRQQLVLDALARTSTPARVIFSGSPDSKADGEAFERRVAELGLQERVEWRGYVTSRDMIELYANARGVIFPPFDEDLGYVTLEAMLAAKPIITTTDSGGPLEFVRDGKEGLVAKPEPQALAKAMDRLQTSDDLVRDIGGRARARYDTLSISWDNVVKALTR